MRATSRRQFLTAASAGLAATTLAPLLSACSGGDGDRPNAAEATVGPKPEKVSGKVTLTYYGDATGRKAWEPVFDDFRQVYPDVELDAIGIVANSWAQYAQNVALQLAGGKVLDVVATATQVQRLFVDKKLVVPLDPYIERDSADLTEYMSSVNPRLLEWNKTLISPDGGQYYLPGEYNTIVFWVNTEMFEAAGVPIPNDDWTWDDLVAAGEKICSGTGNYLININPSDPFYFQPWALTNGGALLNEDWTQSKLNDEKTIEAARFAQSLVVKGYAPKPGGTFDENAQFARNKLAIIAGGMWPNIPLKGLGASKKVKLVAWPQKTAKGCSVGWNSYPILERSENKEAAWAFVKYLVSPRAVTNIAKFGGVVTPEMKNVFDQYVPAAAPVQDVDELWTSLDYATPVPSPNRADAVNQAISKTLTQIYSTESDPAPLMTSLHASVQNLLKP